jgi:hypothetical protein
MKRVARRLGELLDRIHLAMPLPMTMFVWFVLPGGTLGFTTWLMVLYAGFRVRSTALKLWAAGYLALTLAVLSAGRAGDQAIGFIAIGWLTIWFVGSLHSASAGRRVWYACRTPIDDAHAFQKR